MPIKDKQEFWIQIIVCKYWIWGIVLQSIKLVIKRNYDKILKFTKYELKKFKKKFRLIFLSFKLLCLILKLINS